MKLTYFDVRARGEPIRLACAIGGIEFEDERISRDEHNARKEDKAKEPLGQLPTLTLDNGQVFSQSGAILRYIGRIANLYPTEPEAQLRVDFVLDTIEDALQALRPTMMESDTEKKVQMRKELVESKLLRYYSVLNDLASQHSFAATDEHLSIADISLFNHMLWVKSGILDGIDAELFRNKGFNALERVYSTVLNHEKVKGRY